MSTKLPPITLERLYTNPEKKGVFIIKARPLPADVFDKMTDQERMDRQKAEDQAIHDEWMRVRKEN